MAPQYAEIQQSLFHRYRELKDSQRFLVQVFAVMYEPLSRQKAREIWMLAMGEQRAFTPVDPPPQKVFSEEVRSLISQELLTEQQGMGACCNPLLVDLVARDTVRMTTLVPIAWAISQLAPIGDRYPGGPPFFRNEAQFMREVRIAIYREDKKKAEELFEAASGVYWRSPPTFSEALCSALTNPIDINWIDGLSEDFFELGVGAILEESVRCCKPATAVFELLGDYCKGGSCSSTLQLRYVEQLWLRGRLDAAMVQLETFSADVRSVEKSLAWQYWTLKGAVAFLLGRVEEAIAHFQQGLKVAGKSQRAQSQWFEQPAAAIYFLALLAEGSAESLKAAEVHTIILQKQSNHWLQPSMPLVFSLLQQQQSKLTTGTERFRDYKLNGVGVEAVLEMYCLHWLNVEEIEDWISLQLPWLCQETMASEYYWLALVVVDLLVAYQPETPFARRVQTLQSLTDAGSLLTVVERKEDWERSLDALTALAGPIATEVAPKPTLEPTYRLIWKLRFHSMDNWLLTPVEQKLSTKGGWTKGKKLTAKNLYGRFSLPEFASEQDREICGSIEAQYSSTYYQRTSPNYVFGIEALVGLVGHPLVFWEDAPEVKVDVVAGEPELLVKRLEGKRLQLSLLPQITRRDVMVVKETPTRLKVISVNDDHKRMAEVLGNENRLVVPEQAEKRVLKAIASIANLVTVQSDIGGGAEAETVLANAIPHVHLLPAGEGLKVSVLAHPFPEGGSYYVPGEGGETVIAVVDGKRLQTRRDMEGEKRNAEAVSTSCPVLFHYQPVEGEWLINEPPDCLELLLQLQQLNDSVVIEWPEGEAFKITRQISSSDFSLNIRRKKDWFAASGEVKVSDNQVIELQQLMTLLEKTTGQFVQLDNGEFLALTDEFRHRLQMLNRLGQRKGKELRIDGLATLAMEDLLEDVEQLKVDKDWQTHVEKIKTAQEIEPELPETLQANLRDYQRDGFVWLSRLAQWGVGACLADDMGLGKTLQGLAVLLDRGAEGPALVIAPTSVCMNWQSESARFAPSLQVYRLGEGERVNRQQLLAQLGKHDVLVCSYGLVQQEAMADQLAEINWNTIVLDEAQAIKNAATKRSQAVMALQGNFKIIMTGTPIENHLSELWNLFRFINPGLLGSLKNFKQKFANAIERDIGKPASYEASDALRRLIRPFILRRTKDEVLKELPSRTEITVSVELSNEETTFYEALRREAVEKLKGKRMPSGQRHLQVLAEIMKLRRACCNPSLVKPELALPSTKLERFNELIAELLDNGHKALVFSQFVDHLHILRDRLEEQQIDYQYLDGSTSTKKRKQAVDAFQNGKGDVFLISLKAGGSGLNLTAADYVLHMDPWWNPAVEDQASDRAHRIGQQRPVTIYRLVAKGTIEDKIVGLHKTKRDLADSLLTGTDMSGKVSTDELLSLIQQ